MIGGATTSRLHTAVKIDPNYSGPVIHVHDASRSVPVASELMHDTNNLFQSVKSEYAEIREAYHAKKSAKQTLSYSEAQKNRLDIDWETTIPKKPGEIGRKVIKNFPLEVLRDYIDWAPFFSVWMLKGKFPNILTNETVGVEATKVYNDANDLLDWIIEGKKLQANAVIGLFPAHAHDEGIEVFEDAKRTKQLERFEFLRQQNKKAPGLPNFSLADFVAPKEIEANDHMGFFAVTAGIGIEPLVEAFEADHDDYKAIMVKAIADRLAEAFAEYMHEQVRKDYWGYAVDESINKEDLIKESYEGIRPAPGYPACPDHTEKRKLFDLLQVEKATGISLTESYAMYPTASVSGYYFGNPEARYFGLGKISKDQVLPYADRKNMTVEDTERWLQQNLTYEV